MIPPKLKLDRKSLEIMYKSFVLASMEYANVVGGGGPWGGLYNCHISKLEKVHVDSIRLVTGTWCNKAA